MRKAQENDFVVYEQDMQGRKKKLYHELRVQNVHKMEETFTTAVFKSCGSSTSQVSSTWGNAKHDEDRCQIQPLLREILATYLSYFIFISTDPGLNVDDNSTAKSD